MVKKLACLFCLVLIFFVPIGIAQAESADSQSNLKDQENEKIKGVIADITDDLITIKSGSGTAKSFSIHPDQKFRIRKFKAGDHVLLVLNDKNQVIDLLILPPDD